MASGSWNKTIGVWRVSNEECIRTLTGHSSHICSVVFSPEGEFLASGSWDETIRVWRVSNGECIKTLTGHSSPVCSVIFYPNGKYLASGSSDKTIGFGVYRVENP